MSDDSPRLYLMLPAGVTAQAIPALLAPVLAAGDIACLLAPTEGLDEPSALALIGACQKACASSQTATLAMDPRLAKKADCDGAHVSVRSGEPEPIVKAAAKALKPDYILGVGGLRNRDASMTAGELDVDYVMFGEPAPDGFLAPLEQTLERVAWWAEIFNVPCVAYAPSLDDIHPLCAAGAEFIALREAVWSHPKGAATAIAEAMRLIASAPAHGVVGEP